MPDPLWTPHFLDATSITFSKAHVLTESGVDDVLAMTVGFNHPTTGEAAAVCFAASFAMFIDAAKAAIEKIESGDDDE